MEDDRKEKCGQEAGQQEARGPQEEAKQRTATHPSLAVCLLEDM
jgi:hypothetical protein